MALHPTTLGQSASSYQDLVRVLLFVAAVIIVMIALTVVFGVTSAGLYQNVPDPVGLGLPF